MKLQIDICDMQNKYKCDALTISNCPSVPESKCEDLRTPLHGATACDLWIHGRMCQIQCQSDWDFAYNFPDLYVCGTNTGQWKPYDLVPDCIRKLFCDRVRVMARKSCII